MLGTVVSANHQSFVTVDAGTKSFSTDRGYGPEAVGIPDSGFRFGGDEFGWVDVADPTNRPALGDKIGSVDNAEMKFRVLGCRGDWLQVINERHGNTWIDKWCAREEGCRS